MPLHFDNDAQFRRWQRERDELAGKLPLLTDELGKAERAGKLTAAETRGILRGVNRTLARSPKRRGPGRSRRALGYVARGGKRRRASSVARTLFRPFGGR